MQDIYHTICNTGTIFKSVYCLLVQVSGWTTDLMCGLFFISFCFQRKRESSSVLWQMRRQLLLELVAILPHSSVHLPIDGDMKEEPFSGYSGLREEHVVKASALLRLYCALVGIASLRLVTKDTDALMVHHLP